MLYNRHSYTCKPGNAKRCLPTDNGNWIAIILYFLHISDSFIDIILICELIHAKDGVFVLDTVGLTIILLLFHVSNLLMAFRMVPSNLLMKIWGQTHQRVFITLLLVSGGCFPTLRLVSSNTFGFTWLNALDRLLIVKLINVHKHINWRFLFILAAMALYQAFWQAMIMSQVIYTKKFEECTPSIAVALTTSILYIISSILMHYIDKNKFGKTKDVHHYLQVGSKSETLNEHDITHIKQRKGIKAKFARHIVRIYGDNSNFEIGFITIKKDHFIILTCQHLHANGLNRVNDMSMAERVRR